MRDILVATTATLQPVVLCACGMPHALCTWGFGVCVWPWQLVVVVMVCVWGGVYISAVQRVACPLGLPPQGA